MTVAEQLAACKSSKEVLRVLDKGRGKELSRWKKQVLEAALEYWEVHLHPSQKSSRVALLSSYCRLQARGLN